MASAKTSHFFFVVFQVFFSLIWLALWSSGYAPKNNTLDNKHSIGLIHEKTRKNGRKKKTKQIYRNHFYCVACVHYYIAHIILDEERERESRWMWPQSDVLSSSHPEFLPLFCCFFFPHFTFARFVVGSLIYKNKHTHTHTLGWNMIHEQSFSFVVPFHFESFVKVRDA